MIRMITVIEWILILQDERDKNIYSVLNCTERFTGIRSDQIRSESVLVMSICQTLTHHTTVLPNQMNLSVTSNSFLVSCYNLLLTYSNTGSTVQPRCLSVCLNYYYYFFFFRLSSPTPKSPRPEMFSSTYTTAIWRNKYNLYLLKNEIIHLICLWLHEVLWNIHKQFTSCSY